jgi:hypothetical protein
VEFIGQARQKGQSIGWRIVYRANYLRGQLCIPLLICGRHQVYPKFFVSDALHIRRAIIKSFREYLPVRDSTHRLTINIKQTNRSPPTSLHRLHHSSFTLAPSISSNPTLPSSPPHHPYPSSNASSAQPAPSPIPPSSPRAPNSLETWASPSSPSSSHSHPSHYYP